MHQLEVTEFTTNTTMVVPSTASFFLFSFFFFLGWGAGCLMVTRAQVYTELEIHKQIYSTNDCTNISLSPQEVVSTYEDGICHCIVST